MASIQKLGLVSALAVGLIGCQLDVAESCESVGSSSQAVGGCATPALGEASACDLGDGVLEYRVTLPSGEAYVEVFARQNGIQNVATNIVGNAVDHGDGTTTYSLVQPGYSVGDFVEYRFYSYLPASPGVFTPGPAELVWQNVTYGDGSGSLDIAVTKDASVILSSYCCGFSANKNFGSAATVDVGNYHHTADALFGYALGAIPAGATMTVAELVIPGVTTSGGVSNVNLSIVDDSTSWQELTVTWNTKPSASPFGQFAVSGGSETRVDVTSAVADAIAAGDTEISFLLDHQMNANAFIDSKEKGNGSPTYLHVEWE